MRQDTSRLRALEAGSVEDRAPPAASGRRSTGPAVGVAQPCPASRVQPRLLVLSSLFPHPGQPVAGVFIQERMFRVAERIPAVFVVPTPWFPGQSLIRRFRPGFRPPAPRQELRQGHEIHYPRFLSFPGVLKFLDGLFMGLAVSRWLRRQGREFSHGRILDAHFGYPDGVAAMWVAYRHRMPFTVTLRGNEFSYSRLAWCRPQFARLMRRASRVFTVSAALGDLAQQHGAAAERIEVVPNGVDCKRFRPLDRAACRRKLGLSASGPVIITVGWLIERKGQHRVIEVLPRLLERHPDLTYLVVGQELNEPGREKQLRSLARKLGVAEHVRFLGALPAEALAEPLSASDLFVLATRREGWANVLLEAMACGLPVVATDIPGNGEIIAEDRLGSLVPFGDADALADGIDRALSREWDHQAIIGYARHRDWGGRVDQLVRAFHALADATGQPCAGRAP